MILTGPPRELPSSLLRAFQRGSMLSSLSKQGARISPILNLPYTPNLHYTNPKPSLCQPQNPSYNNPMAKVARRLVQGLPGRWKSAKVRSELSSHRQVLSAPVLELPDIAEGSSPRTLSILFCIFWSILFCPKFCILYLCAIF